MQIAWLHVNLEKNAFIVIIAAIEYLPYAVYCTSILNATVGLSPNGIFFIFHGANLILQYKIAKLRIATISN